MNPTHLGLSRTLRGLRTGEVPTFATGVALLLYVMYRRGARPKHRRIAARQIRPGTTIVIKGMDQTS